ncbi:MAG: hypothetical protein J2P19_02025 [Pseudonocardia sp.]|nr:hypothetical protein [Pseudonocardia sp.]
MGTSQSHLSRVELGDTAASMELVDRWVRECGASPNDRKEAAELAESVVVEFTSWKTWRANGLAARQREAAEAEGTATTISEWAPLLISGRRTSCSLSSTGLRCWLLSRIWTSEFCHS